jgi:hypothetical protein
MQVAEPALETCGVILPRQTIHPWRSIAFQFIKRQPQQVDADVVQERSEPFLLPCSCTSRTRFSACVTLIRFCARRVLCRPAFPSALTLRSTNSAADCPALFVGFLVTMAGSDSSRPFTIGYGSSPSRCGPLRANPLVRREASRFPSKDHLHVPGSSTTPGRSNARASAPARIAFRYLNGVGTRDIISFAAQWLACALPCRRFAIILTDYRARLGADAGRYSFIAMDSHHLVLAGLPAHSD